MTRDEFVARFPKASEDTIRRNVGPESGAPGPKPKRSVQADVAIKEPVKTSHPTKCLVRVESRRVQLQDPDNGIYKWHIDALRYAGILSDDTTAEIELQIAPQVKVATKREECTVIEITPI